VKTRKNKITFSLMHLLNEQLIDYNILTSFTNYGLRQNLTDFEDDLAMIVPLI